MLANVRILDDLLGKTLVGIKVDNNDALITFTTEIGEQFTMQHIQDCCENVSIEDVTGDLDDLLYNPLVEAEEVTSHTNPDGTEVSECQESFTWTFYKFRTKKGCVTIRWYGESNGNYSESVEVARKSASFVKIFKAYQKTYGTNEAYSRLSNETNIPINKLKELFTLNLLKT
jgi:hypothetical protein